MGRSEPVRYSVRLGASALNSAHYARADEAVRVAAIKEAFRPWLWPLGATDPRYGVSQQLADLFKSNDGNTLGAEIARRVALPPPNGEQSH